MRHFLKEKKSKNFKFFLKNVFCAFWALDIAPTLDVPVLFFLQTTILTLIGPLFINNPETTWGQGRLSPKGPPFIFSLFQGNLQNRTCLKGPPFGFFSALCDFFSKKFLMFQKGPPLRVFSYFATECMLINPKGPPFTFFGTMRLFLKEFFFQK